MIINQRTVKYLVVAIDYAARTSQRISVTDIESLNAITVMNVLRNGLDHGMSLETYTYEEQDQLEEAVMFDATEMISFKVLNGLQVRGTIHLIDGRALPESLFVETSNQGLIGLNSNLQRYRSEEGYAAIRIDNNNPIFHVSGVN
jgi:hypothetical protein